jgi:hypothetical protein
MQGLESLNQFQNFMSSVGGLGRYEDTYMIHAAEGETVVPMEVLDRNPLLKERLFESMRDMGIDPERYIVGNEFNSLNPLTGQPEFFLKRLKKAIADVSGYAAPVIGAMYGPAAGAAAGAAMGSFKRENPGDPSQWAQMGLRGGASGIAANLARGQPMFSGKGYGTEGITGSDLWKTGKKLWSGDPSDKKSTGLWGASKDLLGKGWGSLTGGGETDAEIIASPAFKVLTDAGYTAKEAMDEIRSKGGKDNLLLKGLLGIGGTLGLGKLIGEPEDITVDPSRMRTAPIDTGQVFSPTQPTTVYTDYNIPIAAEGGIIGYHGGGFTGSPHTEGPFYKGEDEGDVMPKGMKDELLKYLLHKYMQEQEHIKERMEDPYNQPFDPEAPIEVARGGVMDLRGGGFSQGPGTGTSDSIPAMLSDGEFVMTADAVRGAGGGNRREGARRMYEAMNRLEGRV